MLFKDLAFSDIIYRKIYYSGESNGSFITTTPPAITGVHSKQLTSRNINSKFFTVVHKTEFFGIHDSLRMIRL